MPNKFDLNEEVPNRESLTEQSGTFASQGDALTALRGSVVGVLESVVSEYEPQILEFTQNIAHQAVDKTVDFAEHAFNRVRSQSWARIGLAAALGLGIVAVLGYEAVEASAEPKKRGSRVH